MRVREQTMRDIANGALIALLAGALCVSPISGQQSTDQSAQQAEQQSAQQPAATQSTQPAEQTHPTVLRSSSDLVRIDVEVTDRSGKPVKGLRADQFSITDDGQG